MLLRLYSKPDCRLCDDAKLVLDKIAKEFDVPVEVINIEQDQESYEKYRYDIPVIFLDDVKLFKHRVDEQKLRLALIARS